MDTISRQGTVIFSFSINNPSTTATSFKPIKEITKPTHSAEVHLTCLNSSPLFKTGDLEEPETPRAPQNNKSSKNIASATSGPQIVPTSGKYDKCIALPLKPKQGH